MEFAIFAAVGAIAFALVAWKIWNANIAAKAGSPLGGFSDHAPTIDSDRLASLQDKPRAKEYRLLNSAEQTLYFRLQEAMPGMIVFAQVGVAQLALLRGREEAEQMRSMAGRGVDFVICRRDFAIVAAIELCWPQPEAVAGRRAGSEEYKRQALERLGIPLIVFRPNKLPDADTISQEIALAVLKRNQLEAERQRARGA